MKILNYIFVILVVLLIGILLFFITPNLITYAIKEIEENYTFTKAICEGNICQDFLISCNNGSVESIEPVSNKIQFSDNWEDQRTLEQINRFCD